MISAVGRAYLASVWRCTEEKSRNESDRALGLKGTQVFWTTFSGPLEHNGTEYPTSGTVVSPIAYYILPHRTQQ